MDVRALLFGFAAALVAVAIGFAVLLFRLKRRSARRVAMRGYLDLIPDLSEEQRAQVRQIRETFLPKVRGIRESLRLERGELARLLFEEPPDRERIFEVARKILLHQSDLENEVIEHILEERELLNPAQRKKFQEIIIEQFSSGGLGIHDVRGRR
jgi:Spy/CpxP family protein refolding chaperone